jgi:Holliday junction resolvase RusA-like endonuclease
MKPIKLTIYGRPAQMGSKRAFVRAGRAVLVNDNSDRLRQWYNAVASVAAEAMQGAELLGGPVRLTARFYFKRPKSHFGRHGLKESAPKLHAQKPDLDKLLRLLCDALSSTVYRDDSQIVEYGDVSRRWTTDQERAVVLIELLDGEVSE